MTFDYISLVIFISESDITTGILSLDMPIVHTKQSTYSIPTFCTANFQ